MLTSQLGTFHKACQYCNLDYIKRYKNLDYYVNEQDRKGNTAVMLVATAGKLDMAKYLVNNNTDLSIINHNGDSVFTIAEKSGHRKIVEYFSRISQSNDNIYISSIAEKDRIIKRQNREIKDQVANINILKKEKDKTNPVKSRISSLEEQLQEKEKELSKAINNTTELNKRLGDYDNEINDLESQFAILKEQQSDKTDESHEAGAMQQHNDLESLLATNDNKQIKATKAIINKHIFDRENIKEFIHGYDSISDDEIKSSLKRVHKMVRIIEFHDDMEFHDDIEFDWTALLALLMKSIEIYAENWTEELRKKIPVTVKDEIKNHPTLGQLFNYIIDNADKFAKEKSLTKKQIYKFAENGMNINQTRIDYIHGKTRIMDKIEFENICKKINNDQFFKFSN